MFLFVSRLCIVVSLDLCGGMIQTICWNDGVCAC